MVFKSTLCEAKMYRVAISVTKRLPGIYRYIVANDYTSTPLSRSINIQGENANLHVMCICFSVCKARPQWSCCISQTKTHYVTKY